MIDTTIHWGEYSIHEPVTVFTDYIITLLCFFFNFKLRKTNTESSVKNWNRFFLFFGLSTFLAGCAHGFFEIKEGIEFKSVWLTGQLLSIISTYGAQQATLNSVLQHYDKKNYWNLSYKLQLLTFSIAVFIFHNFLVVIVNTTLGLIPVMVFHFMDRKKTKAHGLIAYGILISFLTAAVNGLKLSLHNYFNYKDIAHVLIMISLFVMYKGIKQKAIH